MLTAIEGDTKRRILVGIDGSVHSKKALRWAVKMGLLLDCDIDAVTVWEYPVMLGWEASAFNQWQPDKDAQRTLDDTFESVYGKILPVGLTGRIAEGNPAGYLIDQSKDAEMLVLGSRGRGGFTGLLLGSVSRSCAERSQCPALIVHGDDHLTQFLEWGSIEKKLGKNL